MSSSKGEEKLGTGKHQLTQVLVREAISESSTGRRKRASSLSFSCHRTLNSFHWFQQMTELESPAKETSLPSHSCPSSLPTWNIKHQAPQSSQLPFWHMVFSGLPHIWDFVVSIDLPGNVGDYHPHCSSASTCWKEPTHADALQEATKVAESWGWEEKIHLLLENTI